MIYKDIIGYEGYYKISEFGEVIATRYKEPKVMKPFYKIWNDPSSYKRISLSKKCKSIKYSIHRLVAMAFVDGYKESLVVNHIDGDNNNNHFENLEWVTSEENERHAILNNLKGNAQGVKQYRNTSGYVGVTKSYSKWKAQIRIKNKLHYLGVYDTPEIASEVYQNKLKEIQK